jgi:hypothetical protein
MDTLEIIVGWKLEKLHLLVTSRKEGYIERSLNPLIEDHHIICLQSALVDKDIRKYAQQRLSTDRDLKKWQRDAGIRDEIETALMKGAHGMYVYPLCSTFLLSSNTNN